MLEVERSEAVQVAFPEVSPTLADKLSVMSSESSGEISFRWGRKTLDPRCYLWDVSSR
jgi:hypothetical protein